jgi:hypothetical protein
MTPANAPRVVPALGSANCAVFERLNGTALIDCVERWTCERLVPALRRTPDEIGNVLRGRRPGRRPAGGDAGERYPTDGPPRPVRPGRAAHDPPTSAGRRHDRHPRRALHDPTRPLAHRRGPWVVPPASQHTSISGALVVPAGGVQVLDRVCASVAAVSLRAAPSGSAADPAVPAAPADARAVGPAGHCSRRRAGLRQVVVAGPGDRRERPRPPR